MKSAITSRTVFAARKRYLNNPTIKTAAAYDRLHKAYENRFPNRELDFFNKRVRFFLGLLLLFCFVSGAGAQTNPKDVSGQWSIIWFIQGQPTSKTNEMTLTDIDKGHGTEGKVFGTFTTDAGKSCPVTGTNVDGSVNLVIKCPKRTFWMDGRLTKDGVISGNYVVPEDTNGAFVAGKGL
jgi:hypothetical protein